MSSPGLVAHLARRELAMMHRTSALGVLWPLIRLAAQWAVLVFAFSTVLELGIDDFPAFVLCGLVAWTWFSSGVGGATRSVVARRELAFQPRFPLAVIPLVALAVPLADLAVALPLVLLVVGLDAGLHPTALLIPVLVVIQLVLMAGLGWLFSAAHVHMRDVHAAIGVGLTLLFYLTPVFYARTAAPDAWEGILQLNPVTVLVEAWRDVLLEGRMPDWVALGALSGAAALVAVAGLAFFRRLEPGFVDEL